ncbi:MAG: hypothetical protein IJ867_08275 [Clostridia bacterium]|nr:hypothetical protein [Clostridia bacterium]
MDGFNLKKERDSFSFKNNVLAVLMEIKKIFIKGTLKVELDGKTYPIVGRLGMYHAVVDITGDENIKVGDVVTINASPMYVNSNIRREYV